MDGRKLDIAGRKDEPAPAATYTPIPEDDVEEREPSAAVKNAVKNRDSGGGEADGADEKMLPVDEKISSKVNVGEVQFTNKEKQNGDAKLDIGELKSAFVGMGKDELMKCANDPFWVRLRWTLFILFWLLWAAMLVGAIVIIIGAPKCPKPQPRTWYEQGPLTEVDPIKTTVEDLKRLKESEVKGVIADWPLDTFEPVVDSEEYANFLKAADSVQMPVIVGLDPASSTWFFNDSESKADAYLNHYIWANPKGPAENKQPIPPPNNWLKVNSAVSSWVYSNLRQQFYYAPFGKPHLNFREQRVWSEFEKVLENFLKQGAKGFRINRAPYLLVDESLSDELATNDPAYTVGEYGFYSHSNTMNSKELGALIYEWRQVVRNKTEDGVLMIAEDVVDLEPYKMNNVVAIDLPSNSKVFTGPIASAGQIYKDMNTSLNILEHKWPLWKTGDTGLASDVIDIITFMLPGSTLIPHNYTVNKELIKRRTIPSITHGPLDQFLVGNETTYAFIRVISGNPGYLIAVNPTSEEVTVDFQKDTNGVISDEVTVDLLSSNYNVTNVKTNVKIKADAVKISPKAAVILTYQPKAKEA